MRIQHYRAYTQALVHFTLVTSDITSLPSTKSRAVEYWDTLPERPLRLLQHPGVRLDFAALMQANCHVHEATRLETLSQALF